MQEFVLYGNGGHSRVIQDLIVKLGGKVLEIFDEKMFIIHIFFHRQK